MRSPRTRLARWFVPSPSSPARAQPSRYLRPPKSALRPSSTWRKKMRLTDLCKPTYCTRTRSGRSISLAGARFSPERPPSKAALRRRSAARRTLEIRRKERLTALLPLRSAASRSPRRSGGRALLGTVARSRGPYGNAPLARRFRPLQGRAQAASDALCRARTPRPCGRSTREPGPLPPLLSSKRAAPSIPRAFRRPRAASPPARADASVAGCRLLPSRTIHRHHHGAARTPRRIA